MESDQQVIKDFVVFCKEEYNGNTKEIEVIDEFDSHYESSNAIWWYTRECFIYKMFNSALRTFNGDIIIRLRFFLSDLQKQIETLYKTQISLYQGKTFLAYRGQSLPTTAFDQLMKSNVGIICFNHFLSTNTKRDISLRFAEEALESVDAVGVLFEIIVDCNLPSAPFASIQKFGYTDTEVEILFSMNSFFQINAIRKLDKDHSLYQIQLRTIPDNDEKLCRLQDSIRKQASARTGGNV
ncbi:unnamed protein product [Rotaria sp. Silwood2]|nr:unnamed protein product [Rotaria sp. Silwood2]CAF4608865.1 unnamed protein product [Rotaria sp. Silwood2]